MHLSDFDKLTRQIKELEKCELYADPYFDTDGKYGVTFTKIGGGRFTNLDSIKHEFYKIDGIHAIILL